MDAKVIELYNSYNDNDLKEIESIEEYFHLNHFNNEDAFNLGKIIVDEVKKYDCGVAIVIIREEDELNVFRYISDDKKQKNIDYAMCKRNAVLKTGHSSVWMMIDSAVNKIELNQLFSDPSIMPVAGAFPIYVDNKHTYTIAVSGLHDGKDFDLVIEAMERYLNKTLPKTNIKMM